MGDLLIAVVDDDPIYLTFMEAVLTSEGNRALLWNGPDDAAGLIQREQPDVVILDLWMGACPAGWTILERLRREPATADIPVILCSGDVPVLVEQAPVLWARSCVTLGKPFGVDDLLATIDQAAFPRPERFVADAA
jgi:CheY-like chemotaxis protein